jgi:hypothetical protein
MEIGSVCLILCCYLNPMTGLARRVAIRSHEVFFFTQPEKGIRKSCGAIERCLASRGCGELFELPSEAL